jgi:hypothetical protein
MAQRAVLKALIRVLVPIFVVGHVLSALHFAVVQHTLCAEHGILEHGTDEGHAHAAAPGRVDSGPSATHESAHPGHEACSLWFHSQRNPTLAPPSHQPVADVSFPSLRVPREVGAAAHTRVAILQFAPKQSPPVTLS